MAAGRAAGARRRGPCRRRRRAAAAAGPGGADTRAELLDAARVEFAERGYDGATVRAIADRAGVDPAMVNHWFGGKEALFTAALELPVDPAEVLGRGRCPATRSGSASGSCGGSCDLGRRPAAARWPR